MALREKAGGPTQVVASADAKKPGAKAGDGKITARGSTIVDKKLKDTAAD